MLKQLDTLIGFAVVMTVVSLLVTIVTQIVSSLLGLRGSNLVDAIGAMIRKIAPGINGTVAEKLAQEALTHPVISDSMLSMRETFWDKIPILKWFRKKWKVATAVRSDELYSVIQQISSIGTDPNTKAAATSLLAALNVASPGTAAAIGAVTARLPALAAKDLAQAKDLIQQFAHATDVSLVNLEKWFNSAQDRAEQWFAMHAHLITILASVLTAFVLQLDTIDLLKRISSDSDVRSKLVAGAAAVQKQAETVLSVAQKNAIDADLHKNAMEQLRTTFPKIPPALDTHAAFASLEDAEKWLGDQLSGDPQKEAIVSAYGQRITFVKLGNSANTIQKLAGDYDSTGLQLLPSPYPGFGRWSWPLHRLLGIMISAALLSLGSPFWFNILKSLMSLRPSLVDAVEKKPTQNATVPAK